MWPMPYPTHPNRRRRFKVSSTTPAGANIGAQSLQAMCKAFLPTKAQGISAVIQFNFTDPNSQHYLTIENGACTYQEGAHPSPKLTIISPADVWHKITTGELNGVSAFMSNKFRIQGDMGLMMKMQGFFGSNA
ncbi:MAG: SCP2 sterol-binding domain-containing protein [Chloroflexi bacterium]|nr:SCP2 sterol-binding domain-containing protein [Chloroflexota bacterium]